MNYLKAAGAFLLLRLGVCTIRDVLRDERYDRLRREKGYIDSP